MLFRTVALLLALCSSAHAASTVNPNVPALNAPLNSAPIRNNFAAAANDINNLLGGYAGTTAPGNPTNMQTWIDTTTSPVYVFKYFNAHNSVWISYASLNINSNAYTVNFVVSPPGTSGQPLLGTTLHFDALNLNQTATTGAAVTSKFLTSDSLGRANPMKYVAQSGLSTIFGLPYNGSDLRANFSGDGSFTLSDLVTQRLVTWDKTSDHGTHFMNPQGIPIGDDSTNYDFKATNNAMISSNQSVTPSCYESSGFTISGGQITAVSTIPAGCQGNIYTPSSTIYLQAYPSPGFGIGCQFTATINGSGAISGYSGLPCGSGMSAGNLNLYFQNAPGICTNNGCVLDVAPQFTLGRQTHDVWGAAGSLLGIIYFAGPTNNANAVGAQAYYASVSASIVDPTLAAPSGALYIGTASVGTLNAGNTPRVGIGKGLYMTNATGSPLVDPGEGNIHAYQFTIASAVNTTPKWTLFSNSSANTLDIYNVGAAAIAWSFGTNNGFYSLVATGGNQGAGTINAAGLYVNGVAVATGAAAAGTLTGTTLAPTVVTSSLTTVGTLNNLALSGVVSGGGNIPLSVLGTQLANTIVGNYTSVTASPTALAIGSCDTATKALQYTTNSGWGCNSSITAAAMAVGGITGLGTNVAAWFATPSSANLAAALTDETGSGGGGVVVFSNSPAITTPAITGLPTGSGIATANTASTLVARDGSGNFSAGAVTATLLGNATTATSATSATNATNGGTVSVSTNASFFPLFAASSSNGNQPFNLDATFTYNPSTDTLTATNFAGNASTVTTNANMTGPIMSVGNATSITSQTGTGTTFVMSAGPTITGTLTASIGSFSSTLGSAAHVITSASATALAVGLNGATNPALVVDASTASQAAGLKVTGAATGGTVALAASDSGSNANLTLNAKGSGTIGIGSVSTGAVTITPATTITGAVTLSSALTYGGVTLTNSVSGTGSMALTAGTTFTGTTTAATLVATTLNGNTFTAGTYTLTGAAAKTLTFNNTITLAAGADGRTFTFPAASDTIPGLGTAQTFTAIQKFTAAVVYGDTTAGINFQGDIAGVAVVTGINTLNNTYNPIEFYAGASLGLRIQTSGGVSVGLATDPGAGNFLANGFAQTGKSTVASLPTCNAAREGAIYGVTDALAPAFLATIVGGGTVHTAVYCNGTNWINA